jgi:putative transposase
MPTIRQHLSTYAITISTFQQHRHFQRTTNADLFIATIFSYRDRGRFQLHGFAVMPDHVHVLITPAVDQSTAKCVQYLKGGYSFAACGQSNQEIWHSGYHEHRIRDPDYFRNRLLYIANNPSIANLEDYLHVNTRSPQTLDPTPSHLLIGAAQT